VSATGEELSAEARRLLEEARVGRLATADANGRPHVVPVVFAWREDRIYLPVDHKTKRSADPAALRRIRNLRENPRASLLVDHYEEDWRRLAWVRVDGRAELVEEGPLYRQAVEALTAKYPQYREHPLADEGEGLVIVIRPEAFRAWHA
jgi:PPOX class probable F420-dependent enzyme